MDARTLNFIIFAVFCVCCLFAGHETRRRGWLDESWSPRIHFHVVVWVWTVAAVLAIWGLDLRIEQLWLLVLHPLLVMIGVSVLIPLAKVAGCDRDRLGVVAVAAGVSNCGFTLGAYVCYCLLVPADQALAYAIAWVYIMQIPAIVILYPIALHYGSLPTQHASLPRLVFSALFNLKSLSLLGALVGVVLAYFHVPGHDEVQRWHILDALFYVNSMGCYFGIGMRLRFEKPRRYLREHALIALARFVLAPLAAAGLLWATQLTPWPLDSLGVDVVQVEAFMPAAIFTVIIANLFHLDARLAGTAWFWNTVIFLLVPLPLLLWLLG